VILSYPLRNLTVREVVVTPRDIETCSLMSGVTDDQQLAGQLMMEDKENHVGGVSGTENDDGSVYTASGTDDGNDDNDKPTDEPSAVKQGLMSVSLNISSEDPPNYFVAKIKDGKLKRFKSGTVQEIFNDPKSRFIHLSNVYFRLSMSVLTPVNSSNPPRPTESKCKLKYHLVGIEGLSVAFDVEPVKVNTYKGKKMTIK
jgi:hypothetical protein